MIIDNHNYCSVIIYALVPYLVTVFMNRPQCKLGQSCANSQMQTIDNRLPVILLAIRQWS